MVAKVPSAVVWTEELTRGFYNFRAERANENALAIQEEGEDWRMQRAVARAWKRLQEGERVVYDPEVGGYFSRGDRWNTYRFSEEPPKPQPSQVPNRDRGQDSGPSR